MCGQMKFNLMILATSAHFWPLKDRENCDVLTHHYRHSCVCVDLIGENAQPSPVFELGEYSMMPVMPYFSRDSSILFFS
jgi:hypothetical protein